MRSPHALPDFPRFDDGMNSRDRGGGVRDPLVTFSSNGRMKFLPPFPREPPLRSVTDPTGRIDLSVRRTIRVNRIIEINHLTILNTLPSFL